MRIAIAGTHAVGKSTLAADLGQALPGYRVVEEAYWQLDGEGYVFADVPSPEDFEAQLERSLRSVREEQGRVIFDRSPADYLAYLLADRDADPATSAADWLPRILEAVATLDLIVFVPIEEPDRIAVSGEDARLRTRVDRILREGLEEDGWGLGGEVLAVHGTPGERVQQVMARVNHLLLSSRTPK